MVFMFFKLNVCISLECYFWCYYFYNIIIYFFDIMCIILVYIYIIYIGVENMIIV